MSGLDIFAIIVLAVLAIVAVAAWVILAMLPGRIARARSHPQADAINIGGLLGAILGGVLWPIFLIWAYTKPVRAASSASDASEIADLRKRLEFLEAKLMANTEKST